MDNDYTVRYSELMLPMVRIRAERSAGSGTVIWSGENEEGENSTYILTNHHVVDDLIKIEERWSTLLKRSVKDDVSGIPDVDFFRYRWESRATGATAIEADIVAYDKDEDLALLKLRDGAPPPAVARLYPRGLENALRVTMPVYCVGAGLAYPPVITEGMISQFGIEIENREFWLETAPGIYGNSGGGLFLADTHQFIGVPSRIAVTGGFFGGTPITHLMFSIPITRIYQFLEDQRFRFIYDDEFTEAGEEDERKKLREQAERMMAVELERGEGSGV